MKVVDIKNEGILFKQLITGPAPVGRILNYVRLAGEGSLLHKNGERSSDLSNNIGSAWTTEFLIGLELMTLGAEVSGGAFKLNLTHKGDKVYQIVKNMSEKFDESNNSNIIKIQIAKNCPELLDVLEEIFRDSLIYEILKNFLNKYGFVYKRKDFLNAYFKINQEIYENGNLDVPETISEVLGNKKSRKGATTGENRVPSLIQLCELLNYVVINSDDVVFVEKFFLDDLDSDEQTRDSINDILDEPHQRIFFGAPGTGKSFKLNKEAKENFGNNYERVTFHPNYMYGNFIGAFKPFPKVLKDKKGNILKDENGNIQETITYKYIPGPLMRVLVEAFKNRETNYLVLIEEINRANVAAVFGDFFQLLDRKENGESEYPITTSEEVRVYLEREFSSSNLDKDTKEYISNKIGSKYEKLILPSNLYIWSTMNSADQGVMPMDTAFKRRWEFTYIGIDDALNDSKIAAEFESYRFKISKESTVKWNDFRTEVNKRLSSCGVPEDKLLGPYFISKSVLESENLDKITNTIKNKVLMYLYDDAGKPYRNNLFVADKSGTYSELCRNFDDNGKAVFKKPLDIEDDNENI